MTYPQFVGLVLVLFFTDTYCGRDQIRALLVKLALGLLWIARALLRLAGTQQ